MERSRRRKRRGNQQWKVWYEERDLEAERIGSRSERTGRSVKRRQSQRSQRYDYITVCSVFVRLQPKVSASCKLSLIRISILQATFTAYSVSIAQATFTQCRLLANYVYSLYSISIEQATLIQCQHRASYVYVVSAFVQAKFTQCQHRAS